MYNSRGTIDGNAIEDLSLVVELTKHVHVQHHVDEEDSGELFSDFFPPSSGSCATSRCN